MPKIFSADRERRRPGLRTRDAGTFLCISQAALAPEATDSQPRVADIFLVAEYFYRPRRAVDRDEASV